MDCVAVKPEWKLYFFDWKALSCVLNLVPGTLEIAFSGFEIPAPGPPLKKGTNEPLLIQSVTLFKHAGYLNIIIETPD